MSKYYVTDTELASVADAIRTKGGTSAGLEFPSGFVTAIGNISGGGSPNLQAKTGINATTSSQTIQADDGYDGLSSVQINALDGQAAQTIHPSTSDQTIASGKYLTGAQTVKGVLLTNLDAGNIKKDVVVKIGDSTDDDCVTSVTGTYEGGGGGGVTFALTTHATVATEVTLRQFLADNPIPLVYKSALVYVCFISSSVPTQGSRTYGWGIFSYRDTDKRQFVSWSYKSSLDAPSNVTATPSSSNSTYFALENNCITSNNNTPNTFYLPVGTVVKVCHIPLDANGRAVDTTLIGS